MAKLVVEELLLQLGMPSSYDGYQQLAATIDTILEDLDKLSHVNTLFQEVGEKFHTSQTAVRDNIDTLIKVSWRKNQKLIQSISGYPLVTRPSVKRFLEIAVNHLIRL